MSRARDGELRRRKHRTGTSLSRSEIGALQAVVWDEGLCVDGRWRVLVGDAVSGNSWLGGSQRTAAEVAAARSVCAVCPVLLECFRLWVATEGAFGSADVVVAGVRVGSSSRHVGGADGVGASPDLVDVMVALGAEREELEGTAVQAVAWVAEWLRGLDGGEPTWDGWNAWAVERGLPQASTLNRHATVGILLDAARRVVESEGRRAG